MLFNRFVLLSAFGIAVALFAIALPLGIDAEENTSTPPPHTKLKVRVYYETLCPDSMQFICNQLYYAMVDNEWLPHTDLEFVPYGKVSAWTSPVTNETSLYCQHGHTECELNALHACVVEHNTVEEQLKMINCLMRGYSSNIDKCAEQYQIDVTAAKQCKATRKTADILHKYGKETDSIDISFVPSIEMDGIFDRGSQRNIIYHFDRVFCRQYKEKYNITLEKC